MPEQISNQQSSLLTAEENGQVQRLLGNRCQSLATTVVQLYMTQAPHHHEWVKKHTGVLCFVKDNIKKNYFFRLHCLLRNAQVWEHEMYDSMTYEKHFEYLHMFEGEDGVVAFNFCDYAEANQFYAAVNKKVEMRKKRLERRQQQQQQSARSQSNNNTPIQYMSRRESNSQKKPLKKARTLTKADIGTPTDFKHISHVGWTEDSGFDIDTEDVQLRTFFDKAGVSEKQLQDRDTREFIYDFINKHGGKEAAMEAALRGTNNTAPKRAPMPPPHAAAPSVPPVPPRITQQPSMRHVRQAPPPPPSRPPPIQREKMDAVPPPPPPMNNAVPPAPPPPPPPLDFPTGEQNSAPPPPPIVDSNAALMASIRNGATLKPVEERILPPVAQVDDARGDLLRDIRKGCTLKPVAEREISTKPISAKSSDEGGCDLAGALARALAERKMAITNSEDDSDDSESNDDEWDDS